MTAPPQSIPVYCCPRCGHNCTGWHCPTCASVHGMACNCGWDPPRAVVVGRIEPARASREDLLRLMDVAAQLLGGCQCPGLALRRKVRDDIRDVLTREGR